MEQLKPFDELLVPDSRSAMWVVWNETTGQNRPIALEDFYDNADSLRLNAAVPEDIQHHFLTARHLALYSWFVYRFTMPAQAQAYGSLEFALRRRFHLEGAGRPVTLRPLLVRAVNEGLLRNDGFADWPGHSSDDDPQSDEDFLEAWVQNLPEEMSFFRNAIVHGSSSLYPHHWLVLRRVADAINQLYPADIEVPS